MIQFRTRDSIFRKLDFTPVIDNHTTTHYAISSKAIDAININSDFPRDFIIKLHADEIFINS
ncbi:hypothetical protein BZM27_32235 [Paraburkholderia steynii]|uniref:Uncharacterized protein n=1 Tax=Paraburkholderia steynii TaxID=1245441 RepID=A0A4R0XEU8_9BURK|nr:hypothetical protein BZM27_32235 [Paraburkholderia steynii]